jgi:hypothetical protein
MKFWKQTLLTTLVFFSVAAMVFYTSCVKDPCNNLVCKNGGACVSGLCQCPAGYEDAQCGTLSILRYLGTYGGYTTCNNNSTVTDTVNVYPTTDSLRVVVIQRSNITDTLLGTVSTTSSNSMIVIPADSSSNIVKNITITLKGNQLTVFTQQIINGNTSSNCTFVGSR